MQGSCFRDVAWLNGDRLVLVAREGFVSLVSPVEVLREWDVRRVVSLDLDQRTSESQAFDSNSNSNPPLIDARNGAIMLTNTTFPRREPELHTNAGRTLNVVMIHEGRFFVGGSRGRVLVFEQGGRGGVAAGSCSGGGGRGKDDYSLTRVVSIFDGVVDVVELRPGAGAGCPWVSTSFC